MAETQVTIRGTTYALKEEHVKYESALETVATALHEAEQLFADPEFLEHGWKKVSETVDGDVVLSKNVPEGKMFLVSFVAEWSVDKCMYNAWTTLDTVFEWNETIDFAHTIATLSDTVDIVTYGSNGMSVVSGRDFVSARIYKELPDDAYLIASRSVEIPEHPPLKGIVRAHLHMAAVRLRPDPAAPKDRTICDIASSFDLKGYIPKFVINQVMPRLMVQEAEQNKKHWKELAEREKRGFA